MAATSLIALLDDIATALDDVAVLSKVAAKKTVGVLGDDLALNAEQVAGVRAERELPVVWAVAKGSLLNKFILVPSALLISAFIPGLIPLLLVVGGTYLCFEGAEKVFHRFFSHDERRQARIRTLRALSDPAVDLVALEKQKIKGAVRTDLILSGEIIVIILGGVQDAGLLTQVMVLSALAVAFTAGIYGLVAALVKLDDVGLFLIRSATGSGPSRFKAMVGRFLVRAAPRLMKILAVVGTVAMFLVGGGILSHNVGWIHHGVVILLEPLQTLTGWKAVFNPLVTLTLDAVIGVVLGSVALACVMIGKKVVSAARG